MEPQQPTPHEYECSCDQCKHMAAAIAAQNPDGSYFFTDAELWKIANSHL